MPIDPSLSLQVKTFEPPNPLNQLAQVSQIQAAQRQGELSQMQLEDLQNDRLEMQKFQQELAAKGGPVDLNAYADMLLKSPKHMQMGLELKQKLQQQAQFAKIMGLPDTNTPSPAAPSATPPTAPSAIQNGALGSGTFGIAPEPSPANALAPSPAPSTNALAPAPAAVPVQNPLTADVTALRRKRDLLLSMGTTQSIAAAKALDADIALASKEPVYHNVPGVGLVDPRDGRVIIKSVEAAPTEVKQYEYAKAQGYRGSFFDFKRDMAIAGRTPAQPQAPVAVVDPATGKPVFVSRETAISGRMTPASAQESLSPKEIQKREADYPTATAAITGHEEKAAAFIKDLEKLRDDPGLSQITGSVYGRTPSVSAAGSRAQALYDKIVAKGGFQALQDLRAASRTGGALGNISNQEGKQLIQSFAAIDRRQSTDDVKAALNDVIDDIKGATARMRNAYDMTYSYKSGEGAKTAPKAPAPAANLSSLSDAELLQQLTGVK